MSRPAPAFEATTDLPGVPYTQMQQVFLTEVEEHNLKVHEDSDQRMIVDVGSGLVRLTKGASVEAQMTVAADTENELFMLKWGLVEQLRSLFPDTTEAIRWSDGGAAGSLPPNFRFVRVLGVEQLCDTFLRVTLAAEDLSSFGDAAIHFRIVLPPKDETPEWPTLAPNGSVKWPEGAEAPHKPVYTARRVDHAANTLHMDVFIHEGGRTTGWAQGIMAGSDARTTIGLLGPAGGGLIAQTNVVIASDETGFPPAARHIEGLPEGARADVYLEAEHGAACGYPMPDRYGITLHWLSRSKGETATTAALDVVARKPEALLWFAGERGDAKRLRDAAKEAGWNKDLLRISSFWVADTADA
ncbi:MAG: siderophore-interacting protein [Pseudomonadota bacterium]